MVFVVFKGDAKHSQTKRVSRHTITEHVTPRSWALASGSDNLRSSVKTFHQILGRGSKDCSQWATRVSDAEVQGQGLTHNRRSSSS